MVLGDPCERLRTAAIEPPNYILYTHYLYTHSLVSQQQVRNSSEGATAHVSEDEFKPREGRQLVCGLLQITDSQDQAPGGSGKGRAEAGRGATTSNLNTTETGFTQKMSLWKDSILGTGYSVLGHL